MKGGSQIMKGGGITQITPYGIYSDLSPSNEWYPITVGGGNERSVENYIDSKDNEIKIDEIKDLDGVNIDDLQSDNIEFKYMYTDVKTVGAKDAKMIIILKSALTSEKEIIKRMATGLFIKFRKYETELKDLLLNTGDDILQYNDPEVWELETFEGINLIGRLLMGIRAYLRVKPRDPTVEYAIIGNPPASDNGLNIQQADYNTLMPSGTIISTERKNFVIKRDEIKKEIEPRKIIGLVKKLSPGIYIKTLKGFDGMIEEIMRNINDVKGDIRIGQRYVPRSEFIRLDDNIDTEAKNAADKIIAAETDDDVDNIADDILINAGFPALQIKNVTKSRIITGAIADILEKARVLLTPVLPPVLPPVPHLETIVNAAGDSARRPAYIRNIKDNAKLKFNESAVAISSLMEGKKAPLRNSTAAIANEIKAANVFPTVVAGIATMATVATAALLAVDANSIDMAINVIATLVATGYTRESIEVAIAAAAVAIAIGRDEDQTRMTMITAAATTMSEVTPFNKIIAASVAIDINNIINANANATYAVNNMTDTDEKTPDPKDYIIEIRAGAAVPPGPINIIKATNIAATRLNPPVREYQEADDVIAHIVASVASTIEDIKNKHIAGGNQGVINYLTGIGGNKVNLIPLVNRVREIKSATLNSLLAVGAITAAKHARGKTVANVIAETERALIDGIYIELSKTGVVIVNSRESEIKSVFEKVEKKVEEAKKYRDNEMKKAKETVNNTRDAISDALVKIVGAANNNDRDKERKKVITKISSALRTADNVQRNMLKIHDNMIENLVVAVRDADSASVIERSLPNPPGIVTAIPGLLKHPPLPDPGTANIAVATAAIAAFSASSGFPVLIYPYKTGMGVGGVGSFDATLAAAATPLGLPTLTPLGGGLPMVNAFNNAMMRLSRFPPLPNPVPAPGAAQAVQTFNASSGLPDLYYPYDPIGDFNVAVAQSIVGVPAINYPYTVAGIAAFDAALAAALLILPAAAAFGIIGGFGPPPLAAGGGLPTALTITAFNNAAANLPDLPDFNYIPVNGFDSASALLGLPALIPPGGGPPTPVTITAFNNAMVRLPRFSPLPDPGAVGPNALNAANVAIAAFNASFGFPYLTYPYRVDVVAGNVTNFDTALAAVPLLGFPALIPPGGGLPTQATITAFNNAIVSRYFMDSLQVVSRGSEEKIAVDIIRSLLPLDAVDGMLPSELQLVTQDPASDVVRDAINKVITSDEVKVILPNGMKDPPGVRFNNNAGTLLRDGILGRMNTGAPALAGSLEKFDMNTPLVAQMPDEQRISAMMLNANNAYSNIIVFYKIIIELKKITDASAQKVKMEAKKLEKKRNVVLSRSLELATLPGAAGPFFNMKPADYQVDLDRLVVEKDEKRSYIRIELKADDLKWAHHSGDTQITLFESDLKNHDALFNKYNNIKLYGKDYITHTLIKTENSNIHPIPGSLTEIKAPIAKDMIGVYAILDTKSIEKVQRLREVLDDVLSNFSEYYSFDFPQDSTYIYLTKDTKATVTGWFGPFDALVEPVNPDTYKELKVNAPLDYNNKVISISFQPDKAKQAFANKIGRPVLASLNLITVRPKMKDIPQDIKTNIQDVINELTKDPDLVDFAELKIIGIKEERFDVLPPDARFLYF
jgi:predicted NAD-dependent protein-ADP-ribosyltransferase YbiA (DUF1768 family)